MDSEIRAALDALAELYVYPADGLPGRIANARTALRPICPEAVADLDALAAFADGASVFDCEELHVRTFDLNPLCALEVGFQVYGERYARGTFLVRMRELSRETGVDPGVELADHLTNVLRVAGRVDAPRGAKIAHSFALPALAEMHKPFEGSDNPYAGLLRATDRTLRAVFAAPVPATSGSGR